MLNRSIRRSWRWIVSLVALFCLGCGSTDAVDSDVPEAAPTPVVEAPPAPTKEGPPAPVVEEAPAPVVEEITSEEALAAFDTAWQAVNDYHFDPEFNGVDWAAVREELRPRAAEAQTKAELDGIIREMLGKLGQSHFALMTSSSLPEAVSGTEERTPEEVAGGPGLDLRLRDEGLLVSEVYAGGPAEKAGIRPGWILLRVGHSDMVERVEDMRAGGGAERPRMLAMGARQSALGQCYGPIGSSLELTLLDASDEEVTVELERAERNVTAHNFGTALPTFYLRFDQTTFERDGKTIGRIHFTNWFVPMMKPIDAAVDEMRGYDGIIMDLRGNSGGAGGMVMGVAGHFFEDKRELGVQQMRGGKLNYIAQPRLVNAEGELVDPYAGPVAILIDETSASASEIFAGGMQSTGRVRVLGETSLGAVLPARMTKLPNGDAVLHALGDFKTSDGTLLEGVGVVPDEVVPLRREDLLAGRDPQLEAALAWIEAQAGS